MTYKLLITCLLSVFIVPVAFSQQMPIDFADSSQNFNTWGGSGFSTRTSPTNPNNMVGQFVKSASAGSQGSFIDLSRSIDLDFQKTITLSFYAFDPNTHSIGLKLERGVNPDLQVNVNATSQNIWTQITFDFSTIGGTGKYDRLTIIIDNGNAIPGTFLIDDINDGSTPINLNAIDVDYTYLVWTDEFNTPGKTAVNATNWFHQTQLPAGGSWFNGELQHYTNRIENSFVEGGNLTIVAIKESYANQGQTKQYTSARLNSKFAFTYGRVDVRAKLPLGNGTWPAIWTLGKNITEAGAYWQTQGYGTTNWPASGEIDIMEHGLGAVNHTSSAIHTPSSFGNTVNTRSQLLNDVATNFHVYSMNWSPNQITFLVDGVGYYTYNPSTKNASTWPFNADQYILLNIAMGGIAGTIDPSFVQSPMVIDYVRVYQLDPLLSVSDNSFPDVKIFPNPAETEIKIQTINKIDFVEVYDIFGKFILKESKTVNAIKIDNLNPGLYFLNIYSKGTKIVKKVIIK